VGVAGWVCPCARPPTIPPWPCRNRRVVLFGTGVAWLPLPLLCCLWWVLLGGLCFWPVLVLFFCTVQTVKRLPLNSMLVSSALLLDGVCEEGHAYLAT